MSRRRGLMGPADGWVDTGFDLSETAHSTDTETSYNATTGDLLIYTTKNGTYRNASKVFNWEVGYEYMVDYDVSIFAGTHLGGFRQDVTVWNPSSGLITVSQHVNFIFSDQAHNINRFGLYCTWSTVQYGACAISNFKIYKRLL